MIHATTILAVRHSDKAVLAGDGQVTLGSSIVKHGARKIRRLYNDSILAGFAGSAADSFALFSRFEPSWSSIAAISIAPPSSSPRTGAPIARCAGSRRCSSSWTSKSTFLLSGTGDLIEPDDGIIGIGSGGAFAQAAAKALVRHSDLDARAIAEQSMRIASEICVYTNTNITVEEL